MCTTYLRQSSKTFTQRNFYISNPNRLKLKSASLIVLKKKVDSITSTNNGLSVDTWKVPISDADDHITVIFGL